MAKDNAYLVVVKTPDQRRTEIQGRTEELRELVSSAGGKISGISYATVEKPNPGLYVGKGKLYQFSDDARKLKSNVVIVDAELSPVQARNIEKVCGMRIVDRTGLILDIFARRAESHAGKLQVELAQLQYLLPRLVGSGVIMSRLGGGIGTRGPGEQKLEVDRRKIRARIDRLKKGLKKLNVHRKVLRQGRHQKRFFQVALVGYTNAGKSTLLNALTGADAYVKDRLFATLDPKTRIYDKGDLPAILFTDTVGFIRYLPHSLIKAFHATLEEVHEADLLCHVLDASRPDFADCKRVVDNVLKEIKAETIPCLHVLNKVDQLSPEKHLELLGYFSNSVLISAKNGYGLDGAVARIYEMLRNPNMSQKVESVQN